MKINNYLAQLLIFRGLAQEVYSIRDIHKLGAVTRGRHGNYANIKAYKRKMKKLKAIKRHKKHK